MKVYLAILLFFIAALMFVQLNSNICFGCQNDNIRVNSIRSNSAQVNSNSPNSNSLTSFAQISQISQRFLGTNDANRSLESSYETPSLLNRNTSNQNNLRNLGSQAQENTGFSHSITPNFSNFADRLPLRNLGRNNTNLDTNNQYQQSTDQQQSLRRLPGLNNQTRLNNQTGLNNQNNNENATVYNDMPIHSSQLRSLGRGQAQNFASRDLTQAPQPQAPQPQAPQLRQLPSTAVEEQMMARANPTPSQGNKANFEDAQNIPQIQPHVQTTTQNSNRVETNRVETNHIETSSEVEILTKETANLSNTPEQITEQVTEQNTRQNTRQNSKANVIPLIVPIPLTEEKTVEASKNTTILVLAPPLRSRTDISSEEESEEKQEEDIEESQETDSTDTEETDNTIEASETSETPTADTEETSSENKASENEASKDKVEDKASESNVVLAAPLTTPSAKENQEESSEESSAEEYETTDSETNTTQEESTELSTETLSTPEESIPEESVTPNEEEKQNKNNILKLPLTIPNVDALTSEPQTSEPQTSEPQTSEQGVVPNTTKDNEIIVVPVEDEAEETGIKESKSEDTLAEEEPTEEQPIEEEPTEEEEQPTEEQPTEEEPTETIIQKIDLKDIEVDSELDYWNAYFAKNAKSYNDLVAESKKEETPLLIVDALQGESGTACNRRNPCSLITALTKLDSGGTILIREGNYELRQNINISQSGTEANPLVIRNYPKETVVLSGKRLSGKSADTGLINISNQKYIRIQGLEFTDYSSKKNFGAIAAIMLRRSASNIEIIQNHIHDIKTLTPKNNTSALGIAIYGTSPDEPMKDLLVQGNHIHDLTLGFSESLSLSGNVDGFRIEGNHIHDVDNIGIVVAGSYGTACWENANRDNCDDSFDYARNGVITGNTVYNVDTRKNSAYSDSTVNAAAGIYVDGARAIVVEQNRVYSNGSGFSISSENAGGLAKDIIVRNNLIYNNHRTGMNLGAENANKGRVDKLTVTNNTFYNNDLSPTWGGEIFMEYNVDNSLITNNIFYADNFIYDANNDTNLDINLIINDGLPTSVTGSEGNQLLRNIYHGKGINRTWQWEGKWYNHESFEAFLEASGDNLDEAEGSFDADPGFAFLPESPDEQVGKIRLEPSLINPPARNNAFPLSASIVGDLDKAANPRLQDDALDIGAYEH